MSAPLLITGGHGMLGTEVAAAARAAGIAVIVTDRAELDVTDAGAVGAALAEHRPYAVVNCVAWTDVDGAEADEDGALLLNATAAGNIARAAAAAGVRMVQVSTDYVFAGDDPRPRIETDVTEPKTAYGRTKLAGEQAVTVAGGDHVIARTAWLFGAAGPNFVDTMLRLGEERGSLQVVDDQVGSPTWAGHLAPALVELAGGTQQGVVHLAGAGSTSWFGLAAAAIEHAGVQAVVEPTDSKAFVRPAPRPAFSVLASTRTDVPSLPPWEAGLDGHLRSIGRLAVTAEPTKEIPS